MSELPLDGLSEEGVGFDALGDAISTPVAADTGGFERLYRAFLGARAALGLVLLMAQWIAAALGSPPRHLILLVCIAYAAQTVVLWLLPRLQRGATRSSLSHVWSRHWLGSIGFDLGAFSVLHVLDGGTGVSYSALFVLPMLMAGVMTPRLVALATAALAALVMLGVALFGVLAGADIGVRMTQAGLVGSGFFVVTLLASEMASRLDREERAARGSLEVARQQAQLNRLVIEEMQEGVLVVDRRGHVRAANPAARALLAERQVQLVRAAPFQLRGVAAWVGLVSAVERAFADGRWPEAGRDVLVSFGNGLQRSLRVRVRFTRRREAEGSEDLCVLFLEDNRLVLARSRQEKLAAMGRMSAGIAHEIRNPLSAIGQANALLAEDGLEARQQRLTQMIASNVQRLKRIVDDVMEVAPGTPPEAVPLDAAALVAETCADWLRTNGRPEGADGPLACSVPARALVVAFEPEHLRRVLVNLLDNALRHADPGAQTVQVELDAADPAHVFMRVFSVGAPIPPEVEQHLFEPFFSTRSRGSGLGLYICRELCERYGARIQYRRSRFQGRDGNEFSVRLPRVTAP
ncbi:MAG: histidine kinase [Pelomonas sp.]|nr:histidine kinase [Roseateles sp.]